MKKQTPKSKSKPRPKPVTIIMPPRDYQPSKAEKEAEVKMPGASLKAVRDAFFRPVNARIKAVKKEPKRKR